VRLEFELYRSISTDIGIMAKKKNKRLFWVVLIENLGPILTGLAKLLGVVALIASSFSTFLKVFLEKIL
jgi:hypothetical protein